MPLDPVSLKYMAEILVPIVAILAALGMPVAIIWLVKHFKLRNRELDLEAQLHGKELELRLKTLEVRQAAIETAVTAIGRTTPVEAPPAQQRVSLLEGPATSAEPTAETADPLRVRSR
jgi:hypothetical protein